MNNNSPCAYNNSLLLLLGRSARNNSDLKLDSISPVEHIWTTAIRIFFSNDAICYTKIYIESIKFLIRRSIMLNTVNFTNRCYPLSWLQCDSSKTVSHSLKMQHHSPLLLICLASLILTLFQAIFSLMSPISPWYC